mmetsp:Transcript_26661/g.63188  ORF Transcript_26661/g.63188 Transcript_26661/m.63188 type:complete len:569 (-) Transcript_26661:965-2671(-)
MLVVPPPSPCSVSPSPVLPNSPFARLNGCLARSLCPPTPFPPLQCYRLHSPRLRAAVENYYSLSEAALGLRQRGSPLSSLTAPLLGRVAEAAWHGHGALAEAIAEWAARQPARREAAFQVCVRKRPLLDYEAEAGEFDSIGVRHWQRAVVCHDGRLHRSGRRLTMTHHHFRFDRAWGSAATEDDVFGAVRPLVDRAASGHGSTVLCFGQTGTGKTHTMMGMLERAARALRGRDVAVRFYEIHGSKCYDLLSQRRQVFLRADEEDTVHIRGAHQVTIDGADPRELMEVLQQAVSLRRVQVTERNPISSRSHAVCELTVGDGALRFVDLAGSERNYETQDMTPQMHRDSAEINKALMALKDCFRAHGARTRPPFRASKLTQVLRKCFTDADHHTLIVATVSPAPTDLIHSVNSLRHVSYMAPSLAAESCQVTVELPLRDSGAMGSKPIHAWTHEEVSAWLGAAEGGRFAHIALPPGLDGAGLMKLSTLRLSQLFEGTLRQARGANEGSAWTESLAHDGPTAADDGLGRALFDALRRESRVIFDAERRRRREGRTAAADGPGGRGSMTEGR